MRTVSVRKSGLREKESGGMLQATVRVLRLLTILQARRSWSGADLASRLEVTHRTLRRDVDCLRSLGYPVQSTSGTAGGYSLEPGALLLPLMLDDDEAVAVAVALHIAAASTVAGMEDASQRAMAKLERVLPERLRRRSKSLRSALIRLAEAGPTVELGAVSTLAAACSGNRGVEFGYRDHGGAESKRSVEPHRIVHMDRRWYLVAWDTARQDWRTFRVDRIAPPIAATAHFTPRAAPDDDLARYITRAVSSAPYEHAVRVVLHAPIERMRPRIAPSEGLLEAVDAGSCRLTLGTNSFETTAVWLARLDADFEVEEPAELVNQVRRLGARLARACDPVDETDAAARSTLPPQGARAWPPTATTATTPASTTSTGTSAPSTSPRRSRPTRPGSNQTLTQVNDAVVRLGILQGEYHWHKHDHEDECFIVLEGELLLDIEGSETVRLSRHLGYTVPKGVVHRTRSPSKTIVLMIEAATVMPTGD